MASNHRMFSNSITQSARFLRMPLSTQALYFHLGMQADDDGVVEAFTTLRLIGAAEDDLRVLVSKGFVTILNEDLVSLIMDWNTNNIIRKERYKPSIYKELLVQLCAGSGDGERKLSPGCHPNVTQPSPRRSQLVGIRQDNTIQDNTIQDSTSSADPYEYPDEPDQLVIYATQNLITMNARTLEELLSYRDCMPDDLIREAIDETLRHGNRAYAYTHSILEHWQKAGFRTVADVKADAEKRAKQQAKQTGKSEKKMITREISESEFTDMSMELLSRPRATRESN